MFWLRHVANFSFQSRFRSFTKLRSWKHGLLIGLFLIFFADCGTKSSSGGGASSSGSPPSPGITASHPFGSHTTSYTTGTILPNHVSQATLDATAKTFYDSWRQHYLVQGCGAGRYYDVAPENWST